MKRIHIPLALLGPLLFLTSCAKDDVSYSPITEENELRALLEARYGSLDSLIMPESGDFTTIPADPKNPITLEKVVLGKLLFHETGLALNPTKPQGLNTYSCASCHHAAAAFQSGSKQGIGEGGVGFGLLGESRVMSMEYEDTTIDVQPIRSPTILNAAFQDVMLWNGQFGATKSNLGTETEWTEGTPKETNNLGFEGLETQAIAGLEVHRLRCDPDMVKNSGYKPLFDAAYPAIPESERYSKLNAALAIAAYERTVMANQAPFQEWLRGVPNSLSANEIKGALLFYGKGECYQCHSGPGLNGMDFHALGMKDLEGADVHGNVDKDTRKGRGGFTKNPEDEYRFKTPTLYNLRNLRFLGHGASFSSIRDVIVYKNKAVSENVLVPANKLSPFFAPLNLSETEIDQLTAFVEKGLYDPNLHRYVPESLPTGNCFPVADDQAKADLGCN
ncbi:cytochrome-c peroxidase [Flavobacteriaceae bacterium TP-CH-4]|uniref:Cytochrome-c peroxidase n=1 Tax=Pelagihabitans pacificus TaxID=2696054 RepID=A0A967AQ88_9FLAO|nr:cytochrome c peroxidase [Pelagihabitans pacificus]NHF58431.1 cytochrome-c peroxidase [Pelagihabitans pacificus]